MTPDGAGYWWSNDLFREPVPTPDQVRGRLFRNHALTQRARQSVVRFDESIQRQLVTPGLARRPRAAQMQHAAGLQPGDEFRTRFEVREASARIAVHEFAAARLLAIDRDTRARGAPDIGRSLDGRRVE